MSTMKEKFVRYVDAGFPLIYLNTFEEDKADEMIRSVARGKGVIEWNARGFFDHKENVSCMGQSLLETLELLLTDVSGLKRKILILKDAHPYIDTPEIASRLKYMSRLINDGLDDFNIIIISPMIKIPKELENYLTILTIDYLTQEDIKKAILAFCKEQEIISPVEQFLNELSLTFKGLSEFEIRNILALALSDDGAITRSDMELIFEQKQQVIQKSGILEMIPLKESLEDIGGLESLKKWLKRKEKIFKNIDKAEKYGVDVPKGGY